MIAEVLAVLQGRSSKWPALRKDFLKTNPLCAVCRGSKKLNVHHIVPFSIDKGRELDPNNLITLCEDGFGCHIAIGHLGDYKGWNPDVRADAHLWSLKIIQNKRRIANRKN